MPAAQPQPDRSPWRRVIPAVSQLLLGLFGWYAYARITTPPAAGWAATDPDAYVRGTIDLALLPPPPKPVTKAYADPNALLWRFRRADALPDYLVDYLARAEPVLAAALVAVAAESPPGADRRDASRRVNTVGGPEVQFLQTVAARMEQAADAGDYRTSMQLARVLNALRESGHWNAWAGRSFPSAIGMVLQRYAVPAEDSAVLIDDLRANDGLRLSEYVLRDWRLHGDLEALLDRHYTRDADGNGWLVVTTMDQSVFGRESNPSGGWNLLSGCFYTRAEMRARLREQVARFRRLDEMPVTSLLRDGAYQAQTSYTPLSGPLGAATASPDFWQIVEAMHTVNRRRALVVMASLSARRAARGAYPQQADVGAWPLDLETGLPFPYQPDPEGSRYILRRAPQQVWHTGANRRWVYRQHNPPLPEHTEP